MTRAISLLIARAFLAGEPGQWNHTSVTVRGNWTFMHHQRRVYNPGNYAGVWKIAEHSLGVVSMRPWHPDAPGPDDTVINRLNAICKVASNRSHFFHHGMLGTKRRPQWMFRGQYLTPGCVCHINPIR